ncbi:MAG TPA: plastocyanin/azurin family copper-binding protein [Gemmatimonadaceae bacterium]|nr:plastocyanin/azurin family copper-binding protein [Gemmatimonadaceae bacterium]
MRTTSAFLVAAAFALTACGGGGEKQADTSAAAQPSATPAPAAAAQNPGAPAAAGTAAAITGKTWDVKMIGDASGYKFDPANLTIKVGDGIKFTVTSGPPHNVTFWSDSIPSGAAGQLGANMPNTTAPLTGPLLMNPNDTYTVSFAGVPAGTYKFYCTPHLALGMHGQVTVQ